MKIFPCVTHFCDTSRFSISNIANFVGKNQSTFFFFLQQIVKEQQYLSKVTDYIFQLFLVSTYFCILCKPLISLQFKKGNSEMLCPNVRGGNFKGIVFYRIQVLNSVLSWTIGKNYVFCTPENIHWDFHLLHTLYNWSRHRCVLTLLGKAACIGIEGMNTWWSVHKTSVLVAMLCHS